MASGILLPLLNSKMNLCLILNRSLFGRFFGSVFSFIKSKALTILRISLYPLITVSGNLKIYLKVFFLSIISINYEIMPISGEFFSPITHVINGIFDKNYITVKKRCNTWFRFLKCQKCVEGTVIIDAKMSKLNFFCIYLV